MLAVAIAGILAGVTVWRIDATLPGWRARAVARWTLQKSREASALAARLNRPVELRVSADGAAGCSPSITLQDVPLAGGTATVYDRLCLDEYPGITLGTGGTANDIRCAEEQTAGLQALPNCSMCAGAPDAATLANVVRVFPSGEVATVAGSQGATISFTSARNPTRENTVAVGIRNVSGRSQIYRPIATGTRWACK